MEVPMANLYELVDGKLITTFHPGQLKAWDSEKRVVAIIAGGRSGKTSFSPLWLHREMRRKGPGDYLMAAPNYPLIDKAAGPEIELVFGNLLNLGEMRHSPWQFRISDQGAKKLWGTVPERPARIIFGHADEPQSLEAMSAKAAWLDEAGMAKFKLESWEAVRQRVSLDRGRILITSKPYNLGWMKQLIHDPWVASKGQHPEIDVIRFDSTENPSFPPEELERARLELPLWKYNMQYRGLFTRPAGLIYTSFNESRHKIPRFNIPPEWQRYVGIDFGGVNTAAVFFAEEMSDGKPTGRYIGYREYKAGERSAAEHCRHIMRGDPANGIPPEPRIPICAGGSKSEGQWRREFAAGGTVNGKRVRGLSIHGPMVSNIEVGINKVYAAFARNQLLIFDDLHGLLDELLSYSRELDTLGEPTEWIDNPHDFHFADATRYLLVYVNPDKQQHVYKSPIARPGLFSPSELPKLGYGMSGMIAVPGLYSHSQLPSAIQERREGFGVSGMIARHGLRNF
jgi:hypothetical protein